MTAEPQNIPKGRVETATCGGCGAVIDVAGVEPFAEVECPDCGFMLRVPVPFGPFLLVRVLGRGGMGAVYKAYDPSLDRHVAIKVMLREYGEDANALAGFLREARAAAALNHAHVVQVYTFGQEDGLPYIAMELLEGGRLDGLMKGPEPLSEARVLHIGAEVAEGLQAAYDAGLTHGDIKPANILLDARGTVKLSDFGLAALLKHHEERPAEIWGTPYYIAPEKVRRKPFDHRADIYSLGGTLFHALTGQAPFRGVDAKAVVVARLDQPPPDPRTVRADLTEETARVLCRMLEENPARRHPTYASLLADLHAAHRAAERAEADVRLRAVAARRSSNRPGGRLAVLVTVLAAVAWYAWWPGREAEPARRVHHYEMQGGRLIPVYEDEVRRQEEALVRAAEARRAEARQVLEGALARLRDGDAAGARRDAAEGIRSLPEGDPDRVAFGLLDAVGALYEGEAEESRRVAAATVAAAPEDSAAAGRAGEMAALRALAAPAEAGMVADASAPGGAGPVARWVVGVQALRAGDLAGARQALAGFLEAAEGGGGAWAEALRPHATQWLEAITAWQREAERAAALPAEQAVIALEAAREQAIPPLAPVIEAAAATARRRLEAERGVARAQEELARAAREARDAPRIARALENRLPLVRSRAFAELLPPLDAVSPTLESEAGRDALDLERDRVRGLIALHRFLIQRINAAPLPQPIEELGGRLARADSRGLHVAAMDGGGVTPWDQVSTRLYLLLFDHFLSTAAVDAAEKADLCLSMGFYCELLGGDGAAARYRARALELDSTAADRAARLLPPGDSVPAPDSRQPEGE